LFPAVYLKKNEHKRIRKGHFWVFSNEIQKTESDIPNGTVVNIYDYNNNYIASGFYNKNSLIAVRILAPFFSSNIENYFTEAISNAYNLRKDLYPNRNSFRLAFSESDFLPGLIIDKYNNSFVLQIYCYGIETNINFIINVLKQHLKAENIFTKNDFYLRKLESLPEEDSIYLGAMQQEIIDDGKIKYRINFSKSQKTGFYFDQCDNREFIEKISANKIVLDAFCNSGGFGLHAAYANAKSIEFVDSSALEIENAEFNFKLNSLSSDANFICSDVFDYLKNCNDSNKEFNIINLDPPAFAKNKKNIRSALKGYTKLNKLALKCIKPGGFLLTSSCSFHIYKNDFIQSIVNAAQLANKNIQLIHFNSASLDHPALPAMNETAYLKFCVFKVL
jgi:23S rRNA (cytosine1962-C5)-methyltransferase